jgi:glycopeptide antibiotics resistance protein
VEETLHLGFRIDYLLHAGVFFLTGIVFFFRSNKMGLWIALFSVYSLALELSQKFIASRTFNPLDFLANILGLILAYIFIKYLNRRIYG